MFLEFINVFIMLTEDLDIVANADVKMVQKDGRKFFDVQKVSISFSLGRLRIQLSNLYNGLKALGECKSVNIE